MAPEGRWWWCVGPISILQTGRDRMCPFAAMSLDMGWSLSAGMAQPASTLLSLLLHWEEQKSKQRLGNLCKIQNEPKFQLPDHPLHLQHISVQPRCLPVVGYFIALYFLFNFSRTRDVHPRLSEPDFPITVSHGEGQIFTDKHPTHVLSRIPSANTSPVVCAESCKCSSERFLHVLSLSSPGMWTENPQSEIT